MQESPTDDPHAPKAGAAPTKKLPDPATMEWSPRRTHPPEPQPLGASFIGLNADCEFPELRAELRKYRLESDTPGSARSCLYFPETQTYTVDGDAGQWAAIAMHNRREGRDDSEAVAKLRDRLDFLRSRASSGARERAEDSGGEAPDPVTLDQIAVLIRKSKRSLEGWLRKGKLPAPDYPSSARGEAHRWEWGKARPRLEELTKLKLPRRYPRME